MIEHGICYSCKHFDKNSSNRKCKAYPKKIPNRIFAGRVLHTKPLPNDNGIQYEPIKELK